VTTGPGATSEQALAPAPVGELVGKWAGTYVAYRHPMNLTLEISSVQGGDIAGNVTFEPLVEVRDALGTPDGSFPVRGRYDRTTRTFELHPHGAERTPSLRDRAYSLYGVYDVGGESLAGEVGSRARRSGEGAPFTLMRPDVADDALHGPMRRSRRGRSELERLRSSPLIDLVAGALSGSQGEDTVLNWASRLTAEYPGVEPEHIELGRLFSLGANLLEDQHFQAAFGETFDQLSPANRAAIARTLRDAGPDSPLRPYRGLSRAVATGRSGSLWILSSYFTRRAIRSWRRTALARIDRLPPSPESFDEIEAIEQSALEWGRGLWPSEQVGFSEQADRTRARLAWPTLSASADAAIATASGMEGARALAAWPDRNAALLRMVSPEQRAELTGRVDAVLRAFLGPLLDSEVAELSGLGRGLTAVRAGNAWHSRLHRRYGFAAAELAFREAVRSLQRRRGGDLADAEPALRRTLDQLNRESTVDALVSSTLAVPGDRETPAGRRLVTSAAGRKATVRSERNERLTVGAVLLVLALSASADEPGEASETGCVVEGGQRVFRDWLVGETLRLALPDAPESEVTTYQRAISYLFDGLPSGREQAAEAFSTALGDYLESQNSTVRDNPILKDLLVGVAVSCAG